jgi:broad specificity phosphatase PhoE
LSVLYLVRHGQAGTRERYDSLSDLGQRQAELLGEYFRSQDIEFEAIYSGTLSRQRATALAVLPGGEPIEDPGWNEFDLAQVYAGYAPHLSAEDADFRREYEEMQAAVVSSRGAHDHPVHRKWNDCDKKLVRAWVESRYEYSGESWPSFVARIYAAFDRLLARIGEGNTIVFTSATPIGVCSARTLELDDARAMRMAGVLMNASYSTLRIRGSEVTLFSLNNGPHLSEAALRTFR